MTEVVDPAIVDLVCSYADMLQVGTRNMQNFALLQAVGAAGKPVLLKRGMNATIEEWLMAAEYIAQRGNLDIVLCERGIRTFETATRNTLDISAVPVAQRLSHLPVIVDPSHSGGRRDLVAAAQPRGDRRGRGRHHRRRPPAPGRRAVRRRPGADRRRHPGSRGHGRHAAAAARPDPDPRAPAGRNRLTTLTPAAGSDEAPVTLVAANAMTRPPAWWRPGLPSKGRLPPGSPRCR